MEERSFNRERARAALKRIANKARVLRRELEKIDRTAWHGTSSFGVLDVRDDPRRDYQKWDVLIEDLRATEEAADEQYSTLKKLKRPADIALEVFLSSLAQLYEEGTGRRASPSTNPHTGEVTGPFLRYMQAVTSKLPSEKKDLSPNQIRHFARHFNDI